MIGIGENNEPVENATNATIVTTLFFKTVFFALLSEWKISLNNISSL